MGMLVLTRRQGQRIFIGGGAMNGGITIEIIEVKGEQIRVGIDAPADLRVDREEVAERLHD